MAFINPFLKPKEVAQDALDAGSTIPTSLATAAMLGPIAIGGAYGMKAMSSNEGGFLKSFSTNSMKDMGTTVGTNLRNLERMKQDLREKSAQKLKEDLAGGKLLQRLQQGVGTTLKSELMAISELIADPASGIDEVKAQDIRQRLSAAMQSADEGLEIAAREQLTDVVETLRTSDAQMELYDNYRRRAIRAKEHLAAPNVSLGIRNEPYQSIMGNDGIFAGMNQGRRNDVNQAMEAINSLYGRDSKSTIDLLKVNERITGANGSDSFSIYARINRGRNKSITVPVSYARVNGAPITRAGSLATPYSTTQQFLNASEAEALLNQGKSVKSAFMRPEMAFLDALQREARKVGGINYVDERWFADYQRTFFERLPRVGQVDPQTQKLVASNLPTRTAYATLLGMEQVQDPTMFRARLGISPGMESAGAAEVRDIAFGSGRYGQIGLATNATVISNQRIGVSPGITDIERRILTPLTARIEQLYDRGGLTSFVTRQSQGTVKNVNTAFAMASEALEVGGIAQGTISKTVFFDVTKGAGARTGLSEGELYMGGSRFVKEAIQPTVLDPFAMTEANKPTMSRKLYNKIIESGDQGLRISGRKNIQKFFHEYGTVLGTSGTADVRVKPTPDMEELFLRVSDTSAEGGQPKVYLGGYTVTRYAEDSLGTGKVYSVAGKGMTRKLTAASLGTYFKRVFGDAFNVGNLGFGNLTNAKNTALVTGDTLFKAPSFLASQMVSGMGVAQGMGEKQIASGIDDLFRSVQVDRAAVFGAGGSQADMQRRYLMGLTRNVIGRMKAAGVQDRQAGMVLAGVLGAARKGKFGLVAKDVESLIEGYSKGALGVASKGVAIGRHSFTSGPQSAIYGANLASLEPRMFQQIAYQARNMFGFSADATNDLMTALMARKVTSVGELDALKELTRTQQSLVGNRLELPSGRPRVGVKEFMEAKGDMAGFMRKYSGGFTLDLTDVKGLDAGGSQRLMRFGKEAFGGSTAISFAGSDILDQIKGTVIKNIRGEDTAIGGQYQRVVEKFSENVERVVLSMGKGDDEIKAAKAGLGAFREDMAEVFAGTFKRIMGGKLRGTGWAVGRGMDFTPGAIVGGTLDLTEEMKGAGRTIAGQTKGQYAMANYQAFVDSMREFAGGAADEFKALGMSSKAAKKKAFAEARDKMMRYFLGMEGGKMQGVTQMVGRHPALGILHTSAVETFRDPTEIVRLGAKADPAMEEILSTKQGRRAAEKYIKRTGLNIKPEELTFQQIRQTSMDQGGYLKKGAEGKAARNFFSAMTGRMDKFFGNVGGGYISFGKQSVDLHYANTGTKRTIDMSIASAMGGDMDGDMYYLMNPAGENQRRLTKALKDPEALAKLNQYRFTRGLYFQQAGEGIKNFAASLPEAGDISKIVMEGIRKEELAKNVGPVDLSLDRIRFGIMQAEGTSRDKEKLLAMMDVLEETMTIKAKKLPRGMDLSSMMTKAVGLAAEGDYTAFEHVLKTVGFRGTDVLAEGATVQSVAGLGLSDEAAKAVTGLDVSVNSAGMRQTLMSALEHSQNLGVDKAKTIRQVMKAAIGGSVNDRARFEMLVTGLGSVQSAMAAGDDAETAITSMVQSGSRRMASAAAKFDKRLLGPLALGVAGALGFGMMVGGQGHSPSAMTMPGEVIAPQVQNQIAGGNIFQRPPTQPDIDSLQQPGNPYADIGNRPIHQRSTYVSNPNAYSMRGEITSLSGIGMMQNYLNMARSSGSITINDTRRPITPNYLDRMMDS